jgi:hypothetical protein
MKRYRWMALAALAGLGLASGCASSNGCGCPCPGNGGGLFHGGLMQRLRGNNCCECQALPVAGAPPCCDGGMLMSAPGMMQGPALPGPNGGPPLMPGAQQMPTMPRLEPQAQPLPANPTARAPR